MVAKKMVVLGDGACGKTSILTVWVKGVFNHVYEPTVFENCEWGARPPERDVLICALDVQDVKIDGQTVELSLWDTAGQEEFDRLRGLTYPDTDLVLLCFSVDQPSSLDNIEAKWMEEVLSHLPGVRICLVACKCDLREDPDALARLGRKGLAPVSYKEGLAVARRIRASRYLECSALENKGVNEAFEEAAKVCLGPRRFASQLTSHDNSCCIIL